MKKLRWFFLGMLLYGGALLLLGLLADWLCTCSSGSGGRSRG